MHVSNQKVVQAKEFDSYMAKYGRKSRICPTGQDDLVKIILEFYNMFLLNMPCNSYSFFNSEK